MSVYDRIREFLEGRKFQIFMMTIILLNCVVMGLETYNYINERFESVLSFLDLIFSIIYVFEISVKTIFLRLKYLKDGWNIFDIIIVFLSLIGNIPSLYSLRSLRFIRVFRSIRLVSHAKPLQRILSALIKSISKLAWTGVMLVLIYYVYAVLGVHFFGDHFQEWFGDFGKSAYSLFQIMTLESWSMGIARPVIAVYPYAWIYFVSYVILSSFIIMNVVVGIIVAGISDSENNNNDTGDSITEEKSLAHKSNNEPSDQKQSNQPPGHISDNIETSIQQLLSEIQSLKTQLSVIEQKLESKENNSSK